MGWASGEVIVYRHVKHGEVWWRTPARVIEDSDELTALWWPAGTRYQRASSSDRLDHLAVLATGGWVLEDAQWVGGDALHVVPQGAPFSIWPFRSPDRELLGWYCNQQSPLERSVVGFDTDDWTLDVVAAADLSTWGLKDEDELVEGERVGLYDPDHVARIHSASEEAVALIESKSALFRAWSDWRPDRSWPAPSLGLG